MASPIHSVAYQEHSVNPVSLQFTSGDVEHCLMFCECAMELVKVKTCDGEQRIDEDICGHFDSLRDHLSDPQITLYGIRAVRYLRNHLERQHFPEELLARRTRVSGEVFEHCESCIYGTKPHTVIQEGGGLVQGLYFKRCNGLHVNALGQLLAVPDLQLSNEVSRAIFAEADWKKEVQKMEDQNSWKVKAPELSR